MGTFFHPINDDDDSFFSPLSWVSAGSDLGVRLGMHRGEYALKWGSFFTTRAGSQWGSWSRISSEAEKPNEKRNDSRMKLSLFWKFEFSCSGIGISWQEGKFDWDNENQNGFHIHDYFYRSKYLKHSTFKLNLSLFTKLRVRLADFEFVYETETS